MCYAPNSDQRSNPRIGYYLNTSKRTKGVQHVKGLRERCWIFWILRHNDASFAVLRTAIGSLKETVVAARFSRRTIADLLARSARRRTHTPGRIVFARRACRAGVLRGII